mmetsp:Transcript_14747/g.16798  ORF Transcript_14747/g.16798 Transcript_14747/m.16798 type:complete len:492 (+) Transcript_14747:204-1679(+)
MMQLTVKTLKGEKFVVSTEPSSTVAQVKTIIEAAKAELPAANMKLIHSGKVLKDENTIESCNIKPNAFLVVMITKAKKAAAPATPKTTTATPAATESSTTTTSAPDTTATSATTSTPAVEQPTETNTTSQTTTTSSSTPAPTSTSSSSNNSSTAVTDSFAPELVSNLTAMGFPEAEVRACLRAAQGNPDIAVEYLMSGIPPFAQEIANAGSGGSNPAAVAAPSGSNTGVGGEPLALLRAHPQINQLRRLVQSNPSTLQAVLTQIGQQQPELLQEITANQELFLQIMNEPVSDEGTSTGTPATNVPAPSSSSNPTPSRGVSAGGAGGAGMAAMMEGMNNPAQMAQMIQSMNPESLQAMASAMGISPDQLSATAQLIGQMPPEDLQNYMNMAMQQDMGGAGGGLPGFMGGAAGGGGGAPPGSQVVRLTEEEMAAVDRLADMGFDRTEAAQAYLACDKNEALAANLLMDGGFGFGGDVDMGGNSGGNDGDDMYD